MISTRALRAGVLLVLAASILCALPGSAAADEWCGSDSTVDWVCPQEGSVYAGPRLLRPELPVPINNRRLSTRRLSSAKLAFEDQANCTLGARSRIYPGGRRDDSIFTQERGSASCVSSEPSSVHIACRRREPCPTELRADGTFLFMSPQPKATASSVTVRRQRIHIVSCDGFVEVRVHFGGEVQEAAGGGSPGSVVVITVVLKSRTVAEPWGGGYEESAVIKSKAVSPGPEGCESTAVQEEEETISP